MIIAVGVCFLFLCAHFSFNNTIGLIVFDIRVVHRKYIPIPGNNLFINYIFQCWCLYNVFPLLSRFSRAFFPIVKMFSWYCNFNSSKFMSLFHVLTTCDIKLFFPIHLITALWYYSKKFFLFTSVGVNGVSVYCNPCVFSNVYGINKNLIIPLSVILERIKKLYFWYFSVVSYFVSFLIFFDKNCLLIMSVRQQ